MEMRFLFNFHHIERLVMSSYLSQFNYQLVGPENGRRWVFLHGLMGYGLNWRRIVKGLEDTERVLTFDQRGHGRSFQPAHGYAPEDYAEDLDRIVAELGWGKFILVGHSMGGRNAVSFAHRHGERVDKLIIEDIAPEGDSQAVEYYRWLLGVVPTPFATKAAAREFFAKEFLEKVQGRVENPQVLGAYFYSNIVESEDGSADWRFSKDAILNSVLQGRSHDFWNEIRSLPMPTLVIRGQHSKELPTPVFQRMQHANPRIEGIEIPNAGHWVHSDQPEEFLKVIRRFTGLP
jgi:pimeloyl-ACP methyl ester carboxylesterase